MDLHIKIGTRDSALAKWQAELVEKKLRELNISTEFIYIKSLGDIQQEKPVHSYGEVGLFTKAIDNAMLQGSADIGVHSLKDLPTVLHEELFLAAVLEREDPVDVFVHGKSTLENLPEKALVATGSIRRKAQWKSRFPKHTLMSIRGNIGTRIQKMREQNLDGMILAAAGLKRLGVDVQFTKLPWMISAPGQGAIAVVAKKSDINIINSLKKLNHLPTSIAISAERDFMRMLGSGCSTAVGALAVVENDKIKFRGEVLNENGDKKITIERTEFLSNASELGVKAAQDAIDQGAKELLKK